MKRIQLCFSLLMVAGVALTLIPATPAQPPAPNAQLIAQRNASEKELESIAIIERKVMVPMRDGKRMATDIYRPKDTSKKYPIIFVRTPYNFNYWDVRNGAPRDMTAELAGREARLRLRGDERARPLLLRRQLRHPRPAAHRRHRRHLVDVLAAVVQRQGRHHRLLLHRRMATGRRGAGQSGVRRHDPAGIRRRRRTRRAVLTSRATGIAAAPSRCCSSPGSTASRTRCGPCSRPTLSQEDLIRASKLFDLAPQMPPVDWSKALQHLPEMDIIKAVDGPHGIFADRMEVSTGGAMIKRAPNDPAWYRGGLWHDDMPINVPGFWFMSWYDVSVGPNLAAYNFVRKTAQGRRSPTSNTRSSRPRCTAATSAPPRTPWSASAAWATRASTIDALTYGWFDHFLKGEDNHVLETMPKVRYFTMGMNKWQTSDTWPPAGRAAHDLLPGERRQGQQPERRRRAGHRRARGRQPGQLHLRSHEPGAAPTAATSAAPAMPSPAAPSTSARWRRAPTSWSTLPSR